MGLALDVRPSQGDRTMDGPQTEISQMLPPPPPPALSTLSVAPSLVISRWPVAGSLFALHDSRRCFPGATNVTAPRVSAYGNLDGSRCPKAVRDRKMTSQSSGHTDAPTQAHRHTHASTAISDSLSTGTHTMMPCNHTI